MENNNVLKDRKLHNRGIGEFDAFTKADLLNSLRFQVFLDVSKASSALFFKNRDANRVLVVCLYANEDHYKLNDQLYLFVEFLSGFSFDVECKIDVVDLKHSTGFHIDVPFLG